MSFKVFFSLLHIFAWGFLSGHIEAGLIAITRLMIHATGEGVFGFCLLERVLFICALLYKIQRHII